jgi:hypothetical protein
MNQHLILLLGPALMLLALILTAVIEAVDWWTNE